MRVAKFFPEGVGSSTLATGFERMLSVSFHRFVGIAPEILWLRWDKQEGREVS
jgi:hypothetical protein